MMRLHNDFEIVGLKVWTDEGISPGTAIWHTSIENAIQNSGCVVVILSPDSKMSEWVIRELIYANGLPKTKSNEIR